MTIQFIIQHGTQTYCLGIMIGRCSLNSQHGGPDRYPVNVGCYNPRYTNNDLSDQTTQTPTEKWTRKTTKMLFIVILILTKEGIEKNDRNLGRICKVQYNKSKTC